MIQRLLEWFRALYEQWAIGWGAVQPDPDPPLPTGPARCGSCVFMRPLPGTIEPRWCGAVRGRELCIARNADGWCYDFTPAFLKPSGASVEAMPAKKRKPAAGKKPTKKLRLK